MGNENILLKSQEALSKLKEKILNGKTVTSYSDSQKIELSELFDILDNVTIGDPLKSDEQIICENQIIAEGAKLKFVGPGGNMVTVKELINKLLDCDMSWVVEARDNNNKKIPETKLVAVEQDGMVCLFG
jgi:hypothetical protein